MYYSIWSISTIANTICWSQVAQTLWLRDGTFHRILPYLQNSLRMKIKKCNINFQFKYILWHGIMSMRSCIVVEKLLKFTNGWLKLIHRENCLILMDILRWYPRWLWCPNYNFWPREATMENLYFGTQSLKQKNSSIKSIPDPFQVWLFIRA